MKVTLNELRSKKMRTITTKTNPAQAMVLPEDEITEPRLEGDQGVLQEDTENEAGIAITDEVADETVLDRDHPDTDDDRQKPKKDGQKSNKKIMITCMSYIKIRINLHQLLSFPFLSLSS